MLFAFRPVLTALVILTWMLSRRPTPLVAPKRVGLDGMRFGYRRPIPPDGDGRETAGSARSQDPLSSFAERSAIRIERTVLQVAAMLQPGEVLSRSTGKRQAHSASIERREHTLRNVRARREPSAHPAIRQTLHPRRIRERNQGSGTSRAMIFHELSSPLPI
jgi:hypothetical protein